MTRERIDAAAEAAAWYKNLRETSNEAFMPLYFDKHRYLVLKGGGGSGKSVFAGRKVLERVTSEPGHRWLVVRKVARTLRESCFAQLIGQLSDHYAGVGYRVNKSDMKITFRNGSEIIFAGLDDVEKLKSIYDITGIWIEEASEILESDFNQLDIRLRTAFPYYLQIILSFNPVSITHWLKKRFFDKADPLARVHESTYRDNRFATADQVRTLEGFRETDEYFYEVYTLGMWGVTGKTVFNGKAVTARLLEEIKPVRRGYFVYRDTGTALADIRWVDDEQGFILIYAEAESGVPYVIGGDTAGEGSDSFGGQVLDNRTGKQVCALKLQTDEDLYAKQLYCLGFMYNTALIGVEANFSTYPIRELERLRYPKQYVREVMDDYTHQVRRSFGWRTQQSNRNYMIAKLIEAAREDITCVSDKWTLEEMLTFVRNPDTSRPEAESGAHDDMVMALAIAHAIREQQSATVSLPKESGTAKWTKDMWEDYRNADGELKKYLISIWGNPR